MDFLSNDSFPNISNQSPVFQVDAKVFYAEAGLEIRGEWRTADGTTGTLSGTKALAGLALGGSKLSGKLFPDADEHLFLLNFHSRKVIES